MGVQRDARRKPPPSVHTRGNAFRPAGRLVVIRLPPTIWLPARPPPQRVCPSLGMQVTGVGAEGQVGARGEAQARDEAGKGEGAPARLPVGPRMACSLPSTREPQIAMNTHREQGTLSYPLTSPGDDSLYS